MADTRMTRRQFLRIAGGTAGISLLAACVPAAPSAAPTASTGAEGGEAAAPAQEPGRLWVMHKQDFYTGYNDYIRQEIVNFADDNNLELEVAFTSGFQGTGADEQKIAAAVQAGDPPDVWVDNRAVDRLNELGTLQAVDDLVEEATSKYGDIMPRVEADSTVEGTFYGVPFHVRSDGGWARKDIFDAAGIDLTTVRTYEQLRDVCMEVSDPDNELWGWGMTVNRGGDGGWLLTRVLQGWGATWTDETGQYVTINSPEAVTAVEWIVDIYTNPQWEPMLPPGVLSWTDTSNNEAYQGEKVAYTQNAGTVYAAAAVEGMPVAEKTVFHQPVGGPVVQEFNGLNGMIFMLIQGAKNPTMAKELIRSFFTDDKMEAVYNAAPGYALPAYESMWDWEVITSNPIAVAQQGTAEDPSAWTGLAWPGPNTAQMTTVSNSNVHTDMVANVLSGQMTAEEAVQDAYDRSVTIFQEFGAPAVRE